MSRLTRDRHDSVTTKKSAETLGKMRFVTTSRLNPPSKRPYGRLRNQNRFGKMGVSTLVRLRPGAAWTMDRVARCTPLNSQTDTYRDRSAPNGTQRDPTAPNGTMIFLRPYLVEAAGADGPF